jgi:hypothetical protein
MEHLHTVAMILLFLAIGLIALKVQLKIQKSDKKSRSSSLLTDTAEQLKKDIT